MKKLRNRFALILAILMAVTLAACSGGDKASEATVLGETNATSNEPSASGNEADIGGGTGSNAVGAERISVSWACVFDDPQSADYYTKDAVYQYISDTYNIDFEIIPLTWGNATENLRIWINSGDMPDVAGWFYNHEEFLSYVDQGMVRRFNDGWKERWPNAAKAYEATGIGDELEKMLGGTYCFPSGIYFNNRPAEVLGPHIQTYMRKDWIEAVGFDAKSYYTIDEYLDIARAIKDQDPGNVGANFYPITSNPSMISYIFPYSLYTYSAPDAVFYKGSDGLYRWGPADEETYTALKIFQDAYREGLIHPEFYTLQLNEAADIMSTAGLSAICVMPGIARSYRGIANSMSDNLGLNPDEALLSAFVVGQDGKYHGAEIANFFGVILFRPDMTDAEFERIMDVIDYSVTEAGQNMLNLGIEGESFSIAPDGTLEMLIQDTPNSRYPSIDFFSELATRTDDFGLIDPSMPAPYREKQVQQYIDKFNLSDSTTMAPVDWYVRFHNSDANRMVQFTYFDEYSQLILKDGDLRANWEAWVREKMQLVQPVLDELNAR